MNISREYFSMVDFAITRLGDFYRGLDENTEVTAQASALYPELYDETQGLKMLVVIDAVKCFHDLHYAIESSSLEGFGLFMLAFDFGTEGALMHKYDNLDLVLSTGKPSVDALLDNIVGQLHLIPDGTSLMGTVLGNVDETLRQKYYVYLYRFMSVVAKADGNIDPMESDYLAHLLSLSSDTTIVKDGNTSGKTNPEKEKEKKTLRYFESSKPHANLDSLNELPAMKELDDMIGLGGVKQEIHGLANFVRVMLMRKKEGLKTAPLSLHCVFTGNPGTGKTTVARILGQIYHHLGLLDSNKFVETDRSGLVAEYVGQTAAKTNKIIDSALDGVLFVDEAYSLATDSKSDFGMEAISTLLKRMEDDRDRLVVILAGYTDNMDSFIQANPGLRSRFSRTITFEDYNEEELYQIFELNLRKYEYTIEPCAAAALKETIHRAVAGRDKEFGNARYVRNIFEKVIQNQANRVAYLSRIETETLCTIKEEDVQDLPLR